MQAPDLPLAPVGCQDKERAAPIIAIWSAQTLSQARMAIVTCMRMVRDARIAFEALHEARYEDVV